MKNFFTLILICLIIGIAIATGITRQTQDRPLGTIPDAEQQNTVPYIGRIQILNGCGADGAAHQMANFLRSHHFDVKNIGNAESWNYPKTLVISRISDTTIATQVAKALKTEKMLLMKTRETLYDVTVIIGPDYEKRIR